MFVILTYDVAARRTRKVLKTCRRYLTHVQKSVFEDVITPTKLERLKENLKGQIVVNEDNVQIYEFESLRYGSKERIGKAIQNDQLKNNKCLGAL